MTLDFGYCDLVIILASVESFASIRTSRVLLFWRIVTLCFILVRGIFLQCHRGSSAQSQVQTILRCVPLPWGEMALLGETDTWWTSCTCRSYQWREVELQSNYDDNACKLSMAYSRQEPHKTTIIIITLLLAIVEPLMKVFTTFVCKTNTKVAVLNLTNHSNLIEIH